MKTDLGVVIPGGNLRTVDVVIVTPRLLYLTPVVGPIPRALLIVDLVLLRPIYA